MAALAAMRDQCTVKYLVWSNTTVDWLALTEACGCRSRTFHRRRRINAHMERLAGSYNSHRSRDEWGQTPIDVAVILGQKDIADLTQLAWNSGDSHRIRALVPCLFGHGWNGAEPERQRPFSGSVANRQSGL